VYARLISSVVVGIEARIVEIQSDVTGGLPAFQVVGLPEKEVSESRERVRSAIKNSGFSFPAKRITANLAPADLRKEGVGFDLHHRWRAVFKRRSPPRAWSPPDRHAERFGGLRWPDSTRAKCH